MKRDFELVNHLLTLVEGYADHSGIYMDQLYEKWTMSSAQASQPLTESELIYHVNLCANAGLLTIGNANLIQMSWAGHDYLDSKKKSS